jgi:hypothetical protein
LRGEFALGRRETSRHLEHRIAAQSRGYPSGGGRLALIAIFEIAA